MFYIREMKKMDIKWNRKHEKYVWYFVFWHV